MVNWFRQKTRTAFKGGPMNKFCSIFSQLLQLFPRYEFQKLVKQTHAERHARGFTCWGQFVSMLFCQLGKAHSLREITDGLRSCEGKLKHLGLLAPHRSTLAYANEHRPWQLYQELFLLLLKRVQNERLGQKRFRFKNKLVSLDSTSLTYRSVSSTGLTSVVPKEPSKSTCSWTLTAIFPTLPGLPKGRWPISKSPARSSSLPEPS